MGDEEVETADKASSANTASQVLYKKEIRNRPDYGIKRVQVMPGLPADYSTGYDEPINYTPFVPSLTPECSAEYNPMTYVFRIPQFNVKKRMKNIKAKCPPFHILFDHTVAVIWAVLSPNQYSCPLGVSQLHWAYIFLKGLRKRSGYYSEDMQIMLDLLIKMTNRAYAMLNPELEKINIANENIKNYDVFGSPSDILKQPISLNYEEMKVRAEQLIGDNVEREPVLDEEQLKEKIDIMIEEMEEFEELEPARKEQLVKDFVKFKDQIQRRCHEQMEVLLAIQSVMKEISPELFPPTPPNPCEEDEY